MYSSAARGTFPSRIFSFQLLRVLSDRLRSKYCRDYSPANMPKKCIKFIPEYLIPNLNNKKFGERLKWIDKSKNIFEIDWRHKAGPEWTEEEASVFVEWDKHKGHFKPGIKEYYSQSKQRFRSLLYKLTKEGYLKEMTSDNKFKKVYCISQEKKNRKKKRYSNVECESCNEEETSFGEQENEVVDGTVRKDFEDDAINVFEDHCYSVPDTVQDNFTGSLTYDAENEQVTLLHTLIPTLSNEPSENFQKRILMERNYENINPLMPFSLLSFCAENTPSFETPWDGSENTTAMFSGKLQTDSNHPGNLNTSNLAEIVNESQPFTEFLDLLTNHT